MREIRVRASIDTIIKIPEKYLESYEERDLEVKEEALRSAKIGVFDSMAEREIGPDSYTYEIISDEEKEEEKDIDCTTIIMDCKLYNREDEEEERDEETIETVKNQVSYINDLCGYGLTEDEIKEIAESSLLDPADVFEGVSLVVHPSDKALAANYLTKNLSFDNDDNYMYINAVLASCNLKSLADTIIIKNIDHILPLSTGKIIELI